MPGIRTGALSLRAFGSNKVIKGAARDPGGSDLGPLPNCYIRPSAKLAVKPINWWLRSNLNGAPGEIIRAARSPLRGRPSGDQLGLRAKLSNSACLSAGSSNHDVEPTPTTKDSQARKTMVRHK